MSFAFLVRLNAISASTFMSLLPVGRWPRISITFAQIINLPRGITLSTYSSMKSRTFLNVRKKDRFDDETCQKLRASRKWERWRTDRRGSAIVRANREGLLNDHYAMYFQQTLLSLVAITNLDNVSSQTNLTNYESCLLSKKISLDREIEKLNNLKTNNIRIKYTMFIFDQL